MSLPVSCRRHALVGTACVAALVAACTSTPVPPPTPPGMQPLPPVGSAPPLPPAAPTAPPAPAPKAAFIRPAAGPALARFDGRGNKGLDIGGNAGDPVLASADGRVVIVSDELRGYGTMIIVRHNETFITAYAHIQRALVKENEIVRQGQPIAEMGSTGTNRVKLHFEIRRQGAAVDPEPYLSGQAH